MLHTAITAIHKTELWPYFCLNGNPSVAAETKCFRFILPNLTLKKFIYFYSKGRFAEWWRDRNILYALIHCPTGTHLGSRYMQGLATRLSSWAPINPCLKLTLLMTPLWESCSKCSLDQSFLGWNQSITLGEVSGHSTAAPVQCRCYTPTSTLLTYLEAANDGYYILVAVVREGDSDWVLPVWLLCAFVMVNQNERYHSVTIRFK